MDEMDGDAGRMRGAGGEFAINQGAVTMTSVIEILSFELLSDHPELEQMAQIYWEQVKTYLHMNCLLCGRRWVDGAFLAASRSGKRMREDGTSWRSATSAISFQISANVAKRKFWETRPGAIIKDEKLQ
ncbi:hypothetical protein ACFIOY_40090 [Bradyrhizobium sp. TZ2]